MYSWKVRCYCPAVFPAYLWTTLLQCIKLQIITHMVHCQPMKWWWFHQTFHLFWVWIFFLKFIVHLFQRPLLLLTMLFWALKHFWQCTRWCFIPQRLSKLLMHLWKVQCFCRERERKKERKKERGRGVGERWGGGGEEEREREGESDPTMREHCLCPLFRNPLERQIIINITRNNVFNFKTIIINHLKTCQLFRPLGLLTVETTARERWPSWYGSSQSARR